VDSGDPAAGAHAALLAGVIGLAGGVLTSAGLGLVGSGVGAVAGPTAGQTAQVALAGALVGVGAYNTAQGFAEGQYAVAAAGVLSTAFGAYMVVDAYQNGIGAQPARPGGSAQGGNGGGRQFAADSSSLSDAENDVRSPAEQFRIDSANGAINASPAIDAPPGADIQANIRAAQQHKWNLSWFYNQVRNHGPWDYKQLGPQYRRFGNFNYGATGKAAWLPEGLLLRSAGLAQIRAGTSLPEWGTPGFLLFGGSGSFGDDPVDQFWIKSGFRYYDAYGR